jgi:putative membrane protein
MVVLGLVLAGVAALLHVYIFWLESVAWTTPRARATFGTTQDEARATRAMAYNQGFYNLFLAIAVVVGIVLVAAGSTGAGVTAALIGTGSMLAAALVLLLSDRTKASAAIKQGTVPLLAVVALVIGLLAG